MQRKVEGGGVRGGGGVIDLNTSNHLLIKVSVCHRAPSIRRFSVSFFFFITVSKSHFNEFLEVNDTSAM